MQKTFLKLKGFRWALPLALVTVMAIGCGSAEEPEAVEVVTPTEVSASPDTATLVPDTSNMPIDTSAGGKPPVNRK
jgi:hypothetical protein